MKVLNIFFIVIFLFLTTFFESCNRNNEISPEENNSLSDYSSTIDYGYTVHNNSGIFNIANYYVSSQNTKNDSVTITITPSSPDSFPKTITIDFGDSIMCYDGIARKGKLIIYLTGKWRLSEIQPQTSMSIEFDDYYVYYPSLNQFVKREGTLNISYLGRDSINNYPIYVRQSIDSKLIFGDNTSISWEGEHKCTWLEGYNTPNYNLDNVWKLEGGNHGTNRHGRHFTSMIDSNNPLIFKRGCNGGKIVQGTITISPDNLPTRIVDFGNGECDNTITIIINGNSYTITQ